MSEQMQVGFIGLGTMGAAVAKNILRGGFPIVVNDLDKDKAAALLSGGAEWANDAHAVAERADIVISMVFGPAQVRQVAFGESGLLSGLRENCVWVDLTSNDSDCARNLANEARMRGAEMIDAPVTGAVDGAIAGKLTLFAGGNESALNKAMPVLNCAGRVIYTGGNGNGAITKLLTNQLWFIHAAAIGEALVLGKKSGLDLGVLWESIKSSVGDSFVCQHDVPSIFAGHYDPSFYLDLCVKDLDLIKVLGEAQQTPMDMTLLAREKFMRARDTYGGDKGEMHVCKLIEDAAGTNLQLDGDWKPHWLDDKNPPRKISRK